jgi:hypothetical protein
LEGGISSLDGVASAVVEASPGPGAHGDVPHQSDGVILETLADVDDLAIGVVRVQVGAFFGRVGRAFDVNERGSTVAAGVSAEPFVSSAVEVEAVSLEGVAIGTDRAAFVIVAAYEPVRLVPVGLVSAKVDGPSGVEVSIDDLQDWFIAEACVTGNGING